MLLGRPAAYRAFARPGTVASDQRLSTWDRSKNVRGPPEDWSDEKGWDRYFQRELKRVAAQQLGVHQALRFHEFAIDKGGRAWFPGCGIEPAPRAYAALGCSVLATDLSSVAIAHQTSLASTPPEQIISSWASAPEAVERAPGTFAVAKHDFSRDAPPSTFDVVINRRAFQGLAAAGMLAAARCFISALRPGGALVLDTINVQGKLRDVIEDSLCAAGFFIPFRESERWYRDRLEATGIVYAMVLGRPMIPQWNQYPKRERQELEARDRKILASFADEYQRRREDEAADVKAALEDPTTVAAHVVYSTG
jgi:SAM-dependent methyltransferase